ncbi:MAG: hypothetical protein U0350_33670 [Caldilineaceae bacterium]
MAGGQRYTTPTANYLCAQLAAERFQVIHDHAPVKGQGQRIYIWFGTVFAERKNPQILARLDIAVLDRATGQALALFEIEDSSSHPKILLSDVLATLLGSGVAITGEANVGIDAWTHFVVFVKATSNKYQTGYQERIAFLNEQVQSIQAALSTPNAVMKAKLDSFTDENELRAKVVAYVQQAVDAFALSRGSSYG